MKPIKMPAACCWGTICFPCSEGRATPDGVLGDAGSAWCWMTEAGTSVHPAPLAGTVAPKQGCVPPVNHLSCTSQCVTTSLGLRLVQSRQDMLRCRAAE